MKVFLLPVGPDRHVPYSEPGERATGDWEPEARGFFAKLMSRFRDVVAAAEQNHSSQDAPLPPPGVAGRIKAWALCWVADRIAEQRLLWQLRGCGQATLAYPSDLSEEGALRLLRDQLKRDEDRHRRWLVVDAALFALSLVLTLVPGPNLIAYYFGFRAVGHYLAMGGARQGLAHVTWVPEVSPALHDLRAALRLDPSMRNVRVRDIATRLELPHLVTFVERVALKGA